ncbi:MAG: head maturation protease, ClpP-related [Candidatus Neomicrothrix subdominans]
MTTDDRVQRHRSALTGLITPAEAQRLAMVEPLEPLALREARAQLAARSGARNQLGSYEVRNAVADDGGGGVEVLLYGEVDEFWGIDPAKFAVDFRAIEADAITLRINSPGGYVYDGIAIYNVVKDHPADITVVVDSLAASIASVIAMAGDKIVMNRGSEMMIHSAWAIAIGDADAMREVADSLDRQNKKIARIYQGRAGADLNAWLSAMARETWYDGPEAVAAGLADEAVDVDPAAKDEDDESMNLAPLAGFRFAGRAAAPPPGAPDPTSATPGTTPPPSATVTAADGLEAVARLRSAVVAQEAEAAAARARALAG